MFEVIILGIIQGLTEFIPISSSAHLRLAGEVFPNAVDPGAMFTASHNPAEYTAPEDLVMGTDILLHVLLQLSTIEEFTQ